MWAKTLATLSFIIALALETLAFASLMLHGLGEDLAPFNAITAHALGVVFGTSAFILSWPRPLGKSRIAATTLCVGLCAPLPLVGLLFAAGFRLLLCLKPIRLTKSEYVLGDRSVLTFEKQDEFGLGRPQSVLEILSGTNKDLRRTAIVALRSVDPKKALPLLQKAIQDSDEQVRLLAQTQFNRILAKLETTVKQMESDLSEGRSAQKLTILAEHYHELVYLAVSSPETETIYLERAIELLTEALSIEPQNSAALLLLLKCQVKDQKIVGAKKSVTELRAIGLPEESLAPWEAEIFYQESDWEAFKQALERIKASASSDIRLNGIIEFWMNPENHAEKKV